MGVGLRRHRTKETIEVEPLTGRDDQQAPTYGAAQSIEAWVDESEELVRTDEGLEVAIEATAYVDGGESPRPSQGDRVTLASGQTLKVLAVEEKKDRRGEVDHAKVMLEEA